MKSLIIIFSVTALSLIMTSTPPSLLVIIVFQTLVTCVLIWLTSSTAWFSFILFLIFVGGLMVLFIYITSLASNEMFQPFNPPLQTITPLFIISVGLGGLSLLKAPQSNNPLSFSPLTQIEVIFNGSNALTTLSVMTYLLITLIVVVKIAGKMEGPMRHSMKLSN